MKWFGCSLFFQAIQALVIILSCNFYQVNNTDLHKICALKYICLFPFLTTTYNVMFCWRWIRWFLKRLELQISNSLHPSCKIQFVPYYDLRPDPSKCIAMKCIFSYKYQICLVLNSQKRHVAPAKETFVMHLPLKCREIHFIPNILFLADYRGIGWINN